MTTSETSGSKAQPIPQDHIFQIRQAVGLKRPSVQREVAEGQPSVELICNTRKGCFKQQDWNKRSLFSFGTGPGLDHGKVKRPANQE